MATKLHFESFEKEYPRYYATTSDGRRAYIEVNAKTQSIIIYGISNRKISPKSKSYTIAFSNNLLMSILMDLASYNENNAERELMWNYYLYVDSSENAGIPIMFDIEGFRTLYEKYNISVSEIVKLCNKYKNDSKRHIKIVDEAFEKALRKINLSTEDIEFVKELRNDYNYNTVYFIIKYPFMLRQIKDWIYNTTYGKVLKERAMKTYIETYARLILEENITPMLGDFWEVYLEVTNKILKKQETVFKNNQLQKKSFL